MNLELYTYDKVHRQAFVKTAAGPQPVASPIEQVRHYRNKLIGQLVPAIGEAMERDTKNGAWSDRLYFHAATTKKCQHVFGDPNKRLDYFPLFGHDGLEAEHIKVIVPDVERRDSYYWQSEWNEEVLFGCRHPSTALSKEHPCGVKGTKTRSRSPNQTPSGARRRGQRKTYA
ncbi:MAG: hypothetical protein IPL77_10250 [Flavobacteriales bacterium]|nr:hypothetical protein [Flavobacteriales bacterium]